MGRMAVKYPWLLSKGVGANVDKLVQFLESIKVHLWLRCGSVDLNSIAALSGSLVEIQCSSSE